MNRIKILHVITTLERGGAQRVLFDLIKHNDDKSIENIIICLSKKTSYSEIFREIGIEIIFLNGKTITETPIIFFRLIKLIQKIKPDLIHSWLYHSDFFVTLAKIFLISSVPVLWSVHHASESLIGETLHTRISIKFLTLLSYFIPSKIIYCSKISREIHHKFGYCREKALIINNSVDTSIFRPNKIFRLETRKKLGIQENEILIGLIARNDPNKGIGMFIEIIKNLLKEDNLYKFVICGENMEYKYLKNSFNFNYEEYGEKIIMLGEITYPQKVLNGIDILVCPSTTESFGLIALEGICCGTPVIASNLIPFKEILNKNFIVNSYTAESFISKIKLLSQKPQPKIRSITHKESQKKSDIFSTVSMIKKFNFLYKKIFE